MKIKNRSSLLSHGDISSREIVLNITEQTLQRLDARSRIHSIMHREGHILQIGTKKWDLSAYEHIYLLGAGKACNHMAMAVDEILGDYLTQGIAIVKIPEETDRFSHTDVYVGGHPIPNEAGHAASLKMLSLIDQAGPKDLFFCVISGGSSSLMNCPVEGISLADEAAATDILLKTGANIYEINAVRRHISQTNGGMLAKRIAQRGASLIGFGISDAIGNPPTDEIGIPYAAYKSTPIGPDPTTLADARRVLTDYDLIGRLPESIVQYLLQAGDEAETPKAFPDNTYYLLNTLPDACLYAREAAERLGIPAHILTSSLEGEARDVGSVLASIAKEIQTYGNPFPAPCVLVSSGEAVTRISDSSLIEGHGGPGQEEVIGFALAANAGSGVCLLSIDSEGTDGTTDAAGAICDSTTRAAAEQAQTDLRRALRTHSSYEALSSLKDTVITGNTGTNLCDLNILYIPRL